jgi:hypothetical protein
MNSFSNDSTARITAMYSTTINFFLGFVGHFDINIFVAYVSGFVLIITNLRKVVWELKRLGQVITGTDEQAEKIMENDFENKKEPHED